MNDFVRLGDLEVESLREYPSLWKQVFSEPAAAWLVDLHRRFGARRSDLLAARRQVAARLAASPQSLIEQASPDRGSWAVPPPPWDLTDRRVEITGPAEPKMMINALNSGATGFMADLEDSLSPTWFNIVQAQVALQGAVRRTLSLESGGKSYRLKPQIATLIVRPRGWHLPEKHVRHQSQPIAASLVDFGLYFFHNARALLEHNTGCYLYLPKLECAAEAALWDDIFTFAEEAFAMPRGFVRATVLIETLPAAFEMEEILYTLKDHAAGLNAGRWDYIFSVIKKVGMHSDFLLPDRKSVTMAVPFMAAYAQRLVDVCHRHGAHAIGGMAAFVPSRKDAALTERALANVKEDKVREVRLGFDGTWVAHPDLVAVARSVFDETLGSAPHQKHRSPGPETPGAHHLLQMAIPNAEASPEGLRLNIDVAVQYIYHWLRGLGCVALHHLMEDAATAEISRAQIWQWLRHGVRLTSGVAVTRDLYCSERDEVRARLLTEGLHESDLQRAVAVLDDLVLREDFVEFLTLPAYDHLG